MTHGKNNFTGEFLTSSQDYFIILLSTIKNLKYLGTTKIRNVLAKLLGFVRLSWTQTRVRVL